MEYKKPRLLLPAGSPDESAPGFDFTRGDFEDLIDNFTPFEDIPILLGVTRPELDDFCNYIYRMKYKETYDNLLRRAELYFRKAMMSLSKSGNPSAIKVSAEYYVGLGAIDKNESKIIFMNNMPNADSDVDLLNRKLQQEAASKAMGKEPNEK